MYPSHLMKLCLEVHNNPLLLLTNHHTNVVLLNKLLSFRQCVLVFWGVFRSNWRVLVVNVLCGEFVIPLDNIVVGLFVHTNWVPSSKCTRNKSLSCEITPNKSRWSACLQHKRWGNRQHFMLNGHHLSLFEKNISSRGAVFYNCQPKISKEAAREEIEDISERLALKQVQLSS